MIFYYPAKMSTFQERLVSAYKSETSRRLITGEQRLTKTAIWQAADVSSGAVSHWFAGDNGGDLNACIKIAPLLRVNPFWLYDESKPMAEGVAATEKDELSKHSVSTFQKKHKTAREKDIAEINELLSETTDQGVKAALLRVREFAKEFALTNKQTASSQ